MFIHYLMNFLLGSEIQITRIKLHQVNQGGNFGGVGRKKSRRHFTWVVNLYSSCDTCQIPFWLDLVCIIHMPRFAIFWSLETYLWITINSKRLVPDYQENISILYCNKMKYITTWGVSHRGHCVREVVIFLWKVFIIYLMIIEVVGWMVLETEDFLILLTEEVPHRHW